MKKDAMIDTAAVCGDVEETEARYLLIADGRNQFIVGLQRGKQSFYGVVFSEDRMVGFST